MANETTIHSVSLAKAFSIRKKLCDLIRKEEDLLIKFPTYAYDEAVADVNGRLNKSSIEEEFAFYDALLYAKSIIVKAIEDVNGKGQHLLADIARVDAALRIEQSMLTRAKDAKTSERVLDQVHGNYIITQLQRTAPSADFLEKRIMTDINQKNTLEDALSAYNAETVVQFPLDEEIAKKIGLGKEEATN